MTLKQLLEKNAKAREARQQMVAEPKEEMLKEQESEKEIKVQLEEPQSVEEQKEELIEHVETEEQPAPKKRGRKPANRQYMVVEDVEKVND